MTTRAAAIALVTLVVAAGSACATPAPPAGGASSAPSTLAEPTGPPVLGLGGTFGDLTVFELESVAVPALVAGLGEPDNDSDWTAPLCGPTADVLWRRLQWGALEVLFVNSPINQSGGVGSGIPEPHLAGWTYYAADGAVSPRLHTEDGLTLGSTRADVEAVYPGELEEFTISPFPGGGLSVFRGDYSNAIFEFDSHDRVVSITSGQGGCGD